MRNFFNETKMRIILNEWDGVGTEATRLEPALLPSLIEKDFKSWSSNKVTKRGKLLSLMIKSNRVNLGIPSCYIIKLFLPHSLPLMSIFKELRCSR